MGARLALPVSTGADADADTYGSSALTPRLMLAV